MPCALPVHIMRMDQWSTCRTNHAAHAKSHAGAAMPAAPGPWAGQGTGDHTHARGSPSSFRKAVNKE